MDKGETRCRIVICYGFIKERRKNIKPMTALLKINSEWIETLFSVKKTTK